MMQDFRQAAPFLHQTTRRGCAFPAWLLCLLILFTPLSATAEEWSFYYGPEHGGQPLGSYAFVTANSNVLQVQPFGAQGNIVLSALIDQFETGGALLHDLEAREALTLEVWHGGDNRYRRAIVPEDYRFEDRPGTSATEHTVLVYFLLTAEDMFELAEGKAVFLNAGSSQHRFGLTAAGPALRRLLDAMDEALQ